MSKPTLLFIHGSFVTPSFYTSLFSAIKARGVEPHSIQLPSVRLDSESANAKPGDPTPTMDDDAAFIAKEVERLADQGKDVVLMGHSYGGIPVTESTKGLSREERERDGKKGGIVRLAYVTAVVPAVGQNCGDVLANLSEESQVEITTDENGWMHQENIVSTARVVFNDLTEDEGKEWTRRFGMQSAVSFGTPLTYAGYKDIPISYLFCEMDMCITPKIQQTGIDLIEEVSGKKVDVTRIDAGHCPNVSKTEEMAEWVVSVVGKA